VTATRTEWVMGVIRRRIAGRALTAREAPSIRRFARDMQVSPSTVVEAYDRLAAEGLIRSVPAPASMSRCLAPAALKEVGPKLDRAIDPSGYRGSRSTRAEMLRPGCGWLPSDWMPNAAIRRAIRGSPGDDAVLTDTAPRAIPRLASLLVRQLAAERIEATADQVS